MTRTILKTRIAELVEEIEVAAEELEGEATLLRKTISCNREDVFGIDMRIHGAKEKVDRLNRLGAKIHELHDLFYKIPQEPSS